MRVKTLVLLYTMSNEQNNTMTTKDIYQLASELTEKQINNVLGAWNKDGDTEELRSFDSLVSVGQTCESYSTTFVGIERKDRLRIFVFGVVRYVDT